MLVDLVITNKLDPWDIDLEVLLTRFKERLEAYKDFSIPSNLILAYAILLKYKAMFLELPEPEPIYDDQGMEIREEPPLVRRRRKLPITLDELITLVEKTLKKHKRKRKSVQRAPAATQPAEVYELEPDFFEKELAAFEQLIKGKAFYLSQLPGDRLKNFLFVLLLANEGKIMFEQEHPFEDIFIRWLNEGESS